MNQSIPFTCNHTSVGIIVERYGSLLLIERQKFPIGLSCPAGHVETHETAEQAAYRELFEETGLQAHSLELVATGRRYQSCRRPGGHFHDWHVYQAQVTRSQALQENREECEHLDWYTPEHVAYLAKRTELYLAQQISPEQWCIDPGLEVVWYYFLRQLKLI